MTATDITAAGTFLVLESTHDTEQNKQFHKLIERLQQDGHDVVAFDFPQHDQPSSHFVQRYLRGAYGSAEEVGPYTGSLFYAIDRYEIATQIRAALKQGKVVIANHYTGSTMAHQGSKFAHAEERRGFFIWLDNLEFQMLKLPRPLKSLVLRLPAPSTADEQGQKIVEVYDDLCGLFPKDFQRIDCVRSGEVMNTEAIHDHLWKIIEPLLPEKPVVPAAVPPTSIAAPVNPYLIRLETGYQLTPAGEAVLANTVTSATDNVYAFKDKLSPLTIAAAMARLSRRGDDLRVTLLDEFAVAAGKDEQLLHRVITAYGDDSVQQLVGQHIVVEGASNLLTKKLEWGRLAAYLEQSTRYIYFDQKDAQGQYKYYVPNHLDEHTAVIYRQTMDRIFDLYSDMVHKLTDYVRSSSKIPKGEQDSAWQGAVRAQACDAVRPVLPVATKASVGIFASGQALESLITHLLSDELPEARETGQKLLDHARQVIPTFLEQADKPDRGGAATAYRANTFASVKQLAAQHLPDNHAAATEAVTLSAVWPRNELDLVPDMLYEHSSLPLQQIKAEVDTWPIARKQDVITAYIGERLNRRHKPGRALEKAHYSWDLVCDYGIFRDLQRHRMVDDLQWQQLTPRYGYDIPQLVEDAGLADMFTECFDLSLGLYSQLQTAGYALEAQYATLLGHKMRWKITYNAREAFHMHELRTSPQGHPAYRKLVLQMHQKLADIHPMLAEGMKFVNTAEDPELARLATERYTQFKLNQSP
jgi:thymidylate synthase ThyX/thymidylate kinase